MNNDKNGRGNGNQLNAKQVKLRKPALQVG